MIETFKRLQPGTNPAADFARALEHSELLHGRLIEVTFTIAATATAVRHGLRRAYRGGFVVGYSDPVRVPIVVHPELAATVVDIRRYVLLDWPGPASEFICRVWVF